MGGEQHRQNNDEDDSSSFCYASLALASFWALGHQNFGSRAKSEPSPAFGICVESERFFYGSRIPSHLWGGANVLFVTQTSSISPAIISFFVFSVFIFSQHHSSSSSISPLSINNEEIVY